MKRVGSILLIIVAMFSLAACGKDNNVRIESQPSEIETSVDNTSVTNVRNEDGTESIIKNMTLEEKVWQMFFVTPEDIIDIETAIQAGDATKKALQEYPVGGIIYFSKNIKSREQISEMIKKTQEYSDIPLFIAVDEEGGRVARLGNAGIIDKQPPMLEIGNMEEKQGAEKASRVGSFLGKELTDIGFNVDFAPVADIITVENNEDIGDRSFGKNPQKVADLVAAEVRAMQENNLSATLKHFPSNGSTETNTHYGTGVCKRTVKQLKSEEFIPFKAGIDAGADMVMVAHMVVEDIGENLPSTLSKTVIEKWLRGELGFKKVVVSDALNMGAITNVYSPEEAAVMAVEAGVDLVLMSPDAKAACSAVVNAVKNGEISEERINESVNRILTLKKEKGML